MERQEGRTERNLLWKMAEQVIYLLFLVKCHKMDILDVINPQRIAYNLPQFATTLQSFF